MKHIASILFLSAIIFTTSCSKIEIDQDYLVGRWTLTYEDERIANDGLTWYTFSADGTCQKEVYNALAPYGENTQYYSGTWSINDNDSGDKLLTIGYSFSDSPSDSETYLISKKSAKSLHLCLYGHQPTVDQCYILTRSN